MLACTTQAIAAAPLPPVDDPSWTDRYDKNFRKYAKHYFGPGYDWRWFKAQAIAESTLKPGARSSAGAVGLMQILPSTFREIRRANPSFKSLTDPRWNIAAGIHYDRYLYNRWGRRFGRFDDKLDYTFGSYNAGFGGMSKAYRKAGDPSEPPPWDAIAPHVPRQTRDYVARINGLMSEVQLQLAAARAEPAEAEPPAAEAAAEPELTAAATDIATEQPNDEQSEAPRLLRLRERLARWLQRFDEPDAATEPGQDSDPDADPTDDAAGSVQAERADKPDRQSEPKDTADGSQAVDQAQATQDEG